MNELDIGIVGCGTAGGAAAIFLSQRGHRVTVYERVDDPLPVGAGIVVQPTGMLALARLGLLDAVRDRGARIERLSCRTADGRTIVDLRYADEHDGLYGLGMHRGVLFEALFDEARRVADVRCGAPIEDLARDERGRRLLVGPDGSRHGPHDLIVVADGARSQLRDDTALTTRDRPYRWGAMWFVAPDPSDAFGTTLTQTVEGTERMLGFLPTGLGPTDRGPTGADDRLVSLFWSIRHDRVEALRRAGLSAFRDLVLGYQPRAEPIVDAIDDLEQVLFARYHDVVLRRFHEDDVVYLGDAAHAMSPQLGQGANLALYDAMVLVDCVSAASSVPDALSRYSRSRRAHLGFYQLATRWLTPFFQSDSRLLSILRDAFMGPSCRLGFVRRQMVRTMCGIKRGLFRRSFPIEPLLEALSVAAGEPR